MIHVLSWLFFFSFCVDFCRNSGKEVDRAQQDLSGGVGQQRDDKKGFQVEATLSAAALRPGMPYHARPRDGKRPGWLEWMGRR
jgi:hypothetical protein